MVATDTTYGFDPSKEYVIRARFRGYMGISRRRYQFVNGQCIAPAMRPDATEEQIARRGERLAWFRNSRSYVIYERGTEPPAHEEPFWTGQEPPASEVDDSDGEAEVSGWRALEDEDAEDTPEVNELARGTEGDSGEAEVKPQVKRTQWKKG